MSIKYFPQSAVVGSEQHDVNGSVKDWTTVSDLGVVVSIGERVPNWKRAIRQHPVVTGALSATWTRYRYEPAVQSYSGETRNSPSDPWTPFSAYSQRLLVPDNYVIPDEGDSANKALNQALAKLTARVRQSTQACQGLVVLGELRETLQFLMSPGRGIQNVLKDWMTKVKPYRWLHQEKLSRRTVGRLQRNLRRQWLETAYALRPLLSEAEQAAQYFNQNFHRLERFYDVFKATGTGKLTAQSYLREYIGGHFGARYFNVYQRNDTVKFRGAMVAEGGGFLPKSIGFDPTSWAPSLWNLLPYSFIVDYFSNLGQVIDTWAIRNIFNMGLQQTTWSETEAKTVDFQPIDLGQQTLWANTRLVSSGSGEYRRYSGSCSRQKIASLPAPVLQVRCPDTSTKWINIIALVDQFYRR